MLPHRRVYDEGHNQFRERCALCGVEESRRFQRWAGSRYHRPGTLLNAGGATACSAREVPEAFGGAGGTSAQCRHHRGLSYSGFAGPATDFSVHNDVCCGYLSVTEPPSKEKMAAANGVRRNHFAIAMTEPAPEVI